MLSTYPRRPKAEALCNAVDVVVRLHDRPILVPKVRHLRDLHTSGSVTSHELSIQLSVEGELRQHDGMVTGDGEVIRAGLRLSTTRI